MPVHEIILRPSCNSNTVEVWRAGTELVKLTIGEMIKEQCEEVVLEAEVSNSGALTLYQNLGFIRDKRLHRCRSLSSMLALHFSCVTMMSCMLCLIYMISYMLYLMYMMSYMLCLYISCMYIRVFCVTGS